MTALLAIEAINRGDINPNRFITLQDDVNIEGTDGVGLGPGDLVSLNDLLYLDWSSREATQRRRSAPPSVEAATTSSSR
jgi:hypothetical protein